MPVKDLVDGLRVIASDDDTNLMASMVKKLVLYVDHDDSLVSVE